MKVSCLQENLARGLSVVGRSVARRSTLPVLSNILLATEDGRLKLSATDLEVGINCWIGAQVEREGEITIPASMLSDFVGALPPDRVDLDLDRRTQALNVTCGRFDANFKGIDAQEFPLVVVPEDEGAIQLPSGLLCNMIERVAFAAAKDDSRPVLSGVLFEITAEGLRMAAADGYRLSVSAAPLDQAPGEEQRVIIPAQALQELRRVARDEEGPIEVLLARNRNQVFFRLPNVEIVSQLIEGVFPTYEQIIPKGHETRVVASTGEILKAVKVSRIFARRAANMVRLDVRPGTGGEDTGQVTLRSVSSEYGDHEGELQATVEGAPVEIGFNASYLIDTLRVIDTPQVVIELRDPNAPALIYSPGDSDTRHVIMPMHIQQ